MSVYLFLFLYNKLGSEGNFLNPTKVLSRACVKIIGSKN